MAADIELQTSGAASPEWRRKKAESLVKTRERRTLEVDGIEMRAQDDGSLSLEGYACLTNVEYDVGFYRETILPGAFKRTLGESPPPDVQLLINHSGLPLGRTRSGTLQLVEDERGLKVMASLDPQDPDVMSLKRKMDRGDIDQMSFAFQCLEDSWNEDYTERRISSLSIHRGDVSVVNQGASPTTFASIRSAAVDALAHTSPDQLMAALTEWRDVTLLPVEQRGDLSPAATEILSQVLNLVAVADEAVDEAQPLLAALLGVANPDEDEPDADDDPMRSDDGERAAEPVERAVPDHTTAARQWLDALRMREQA